MIDALLAAIVVLAILSARTYAALRAPRIDAHETRRAGRSRGWNIRSVKPGLTRARAMLAAITPRQIGARIARAGYALQSAALHAALSPSGTLGGVGAVGMVHRSTGPAPGQATIQIDGTAITAYLVSTGAIIATGAASTAGATVVAAAAAVAQRIHFGPGTFDIDSTLAFAKICTSVTGEGSGASGGNTPTIIRGDHTTGAMMSFSVRSPTVEGIRFTSTANRRDNGDTTGVGLLFAAPDTPGAGSISRITVRDVEIDQQPSHALVTSGHMELTRFENVGAIENYGHGFVHDDGTAMSRTNTDGRPFVAEWVRCRSIGNAGNALLVGRTGQTHTPSILTFHQFEALDCAWDPAVRVNDYLAIVYGHIVRFTQSDFEDQTYASATTTGYGITRTSRATPTKGLLWSGQTLRLEQPFFSSLVQSVEIGASSAEVDIDYPRISLGTYNVAQTNGIVIPSTISSVRFAGRTQTGATNLLKNQSENAIIYLNGKLQRGTTTTTYDWGQDPFGVSSTIVSGTVYSANTVCKIKGEGDTTDTLNSIKMDANSLSNGVKGMKMTLVHDGATDYDISIPHAAGNIKTSNGLTQTLNQANPVMTFQADGTTWHQIGSRASTTVAGRTPGAASGIATLSAGSLVVENPANATATPTASKIPIADGSGKLAAGWGGAASTLATLDESSKVVEDPANATATPTASKIPIANGSGKLAAGWGGSASTLATLDADGVLVEDAATLNGTTAAAIQAAAEATAANASNLTSGTVPLARLVGITNTEIAAGAAIAKTKIATAGTFRDAVTATKTTAYTVTGGEGIIPCDPQATGAFDVTLPAPTPELDGERVTICRATAAGNQLRVVITGGATFLDGSTAVELAAIGDTLDLYCLNTVGKWVIA